MMRIAVAGGRGLGFLLATELAQAANAYNVVVLSRSARPELDPFDVQVHVVDYHDHASLAFALQGIDLVISTVSGPEQLNLIAAASRSRVRTFVPAEFEGTLAARPPAHTDPLDRGSSQTLALLRALAEQPSSSTASSSPSSTPSSSSSSYSTASSSPRMRYTVFSCGLFMERFHPYGLGSFDIGYGAAAAGPGDFLVNFAAATAEYPDRDGKGHSVRVCLTSVYDVARLVVAAVDLGPATWPREFTMCGDRLRVRDLVSMCGSAASIRDDVLTHPVPLTRFAHQHAQLQSYLADAARLGAFDKVAYYQRLLATANGRFDFAHASLNERVRRELAVHVQPLTFGAWLAGVWQQPM